jgi:hypothetical protein
MFNVIKNLLGNKVVMFEKTFKNINDTPHIYASYSGLLDHPDIIERQALDELKQSILQKASNGELR